LRAGHHIDDGNQLAAGALGEFRQRRQCGSLADMIAGKWILSEIVQREVVVIAVGDRRAVACAPRRGIALHSREVRRLVAGRGVEGRHLHASSI
jgi:hypothetical protein